MTLARFAHCTGFSLVLLGFFLIPVPIVLPGSTPLPFVVTGVGCVCCLLASWMR